LVLSKAVNQARFYFHVQFRLLDDSTLSNSLLEVGLQLLLFILILDIAELITIWFAFWELELKAVEATELSTIICRHLSFSPEFSYEHQPNSSLEVFVLA